MSTHAFVDESVRSQRYLLSAALVDPSDLIRLRKELRALLPPRQRELHFKKEKPRAAASLPIGSLPLAQRSRSTPLAVITATKPHGSGACADWHAI